VLALLTDIQGRTKGPKEWVFVCMGDGFAESEIQSMLKLELQYPALPFYLQERFKLELVPLLEQDPGHSSQRRCVYSMAPNCRNY
jgi:hypothetical protein